jgi:hypothetical protein
VYSVKWYDSSIFSLEVSFISCLAGDGETLVTYLPDCMVLYPRMPQYHISLYILYFWPDFEIWDTILLTSITTYSSYLLYLDQVFHLPSLCQRTSRNHCKFWTHKRLYCSRSCVKYMLLCPELNVVLRNRIPSCVACVYIRRMKIFLNVIRNRYIN